jgi:poly(A) polymerase
MLFPSANKVAKLPVKPRVVSRADHPISRRDISDNALRVLYRLKNAGYQAYLVGGSVRDLLLNRHPKDFDVATDAQPEQVRELFRNCRLIGRRFRLAHVHFGGDIVEVATFRADHDATDEDGDREVRNGLIVKDNVYGSIDQDAWRRDFTVNALYYNIEDFSVVDYVGGFEDIKAKQLRLIGDPERRYREDPVRMLRAVRFAAKLGFSIHPDTAEPIGRLSKLLGDIPPARLFEEYLKLFMGGCALETFRGLRGAGLFELLFPQVEAGIRGADGEFTLRFIEQALGNTDIRIAEAKPVTPAFLLAAFMWTPTQTMAEQYQRDGVPPAESVHLAADTVISKQIASIAIPRRFSRIMREIWALQPRLVQRRGRRLTRLLENPRFRAAYDFLLLRAQAGDNVAEAAEWWTKLQEAEGAEQAALLDGVHTTNRRRPPRRRRR